MRGDPTAFHLTLGIGTLAGAISPPLAGSFVQASAVGVARNTLTLITTRGSVSGIASVSLNFSATLASGGFQDANLVDASGKFHERAGPYFFARKGVPLDRLDSFLAQAPNNPLAPEFHLLIGPECKFEDGCDVTAAYSTGNDALPPYGNTKFFSASVHTLKYELTVPVNPESVTDFVKVTVPSAAFLASHDNPDGSGGLLQN